MEEKMVGNLGDFGRGAVGTIGGKGANLGEMIKMGIPVPQGFAATNLAYERFKEETSVTQKILPLVERLPHEPKEKWEAISETIRHIVTTMKMPGNIEDSIGEAYDGLCEHYAREALRVAVRSSGVAEDSAELSFAGQFDTYLNVSGKEKVVEAVKKCWASAYTTRGLIYRITRGMEADVSGMCVVVQKMVTVRSSGVCFSIDPVSGNPNVIVVEGNWGVGESIVQGLVDPDRFIVNKSTLEIEDRKISEKKMNIVLTDPGTEECEVPMDKQKQACLEDQEVQRIAGFAKALEKHYGISQDSKWWIDLHFPFPDNVFMSQTRPVTDIPDRKRLGKEVIKGLLAIVALVHLF